MFQISMVAAVFFAVFPLAIQAAEVTPQTAEQVARTFWNLHHDKDVAELNSPMHQLDICWDAFYIFAPTEDKGFVIVAADDRVRPVLAYSFHNNAMRDKMGSGMSWWLDGWQQQIDEERGDQNAEWQQLLATQCAVNPNPTNGRIAIEGMPENNRIELYDAIGRLVSVSTNHHIDLSDCLAGVYILRCVSSDGELTRRVVKK